MTSLCEFEFNSVTNIDNNVENYNFRAKGYKKISNEGVIYYFKNEKMLEINQAFLCIY